MSKINAVRLININYNHNAIKISDETLNFNGESTLISLQNGGGKSVLVQLLTAPFVQKRYRSTKDRAFSGYFTTARPSFIIVEWALDYGAGYVMTGMMVRHSQKIEEGFDDELEIVNFINEYSSPCINDIHHLPVVSKTGNEILLKSFTDSKRLFDEYKKEYPGKFFCWDMNNSSQSRQYFDKLSEYGINYKEWQNIIKKINEEESGLSKLFSDCRDEKGLIEKWFLETVENKLNKDTNRIQESGKILEKYILQYRSNEEKIKSKNKIEKFNNEVVQVRNVAEEYVRSKHEEQEKLSVIIAFRDEITRINVNAEVKKQEYMDGLVKAEEALKGLEYEQKSCEYYKELRKKDAMDIQLEEVAKERQKNIKEIEKLEKNHSILECARRQADVYEDDNALKKVREEIAVCKSDEEELLPEREYIGYKLKLFYQNKANTCDERIVSDTADKKEEIAKKEKAELLLSETDRDIGIKAAENGKLSEAVSAYSKIEDRYNQAWNESLMRNVLGEYEPGTLDRMNNALVLREKKNLDERVKLKRQYEHFDSEIRRQISLADELKDEQIHIREKLADKTRVLRDYEEELASRKRIMQYIGFAENRLFDKTAIISALEAKRQELNATSVRLAMEKAEADSRYETLSTGRNAELSGEFIDTLNTLGIAFVYGLEWLKKNGCSEEVNRKYVKDHPFLPYALIMSQADLDRLFKSQIAVYTSSPVPIILRESLGSGNTESIHEPSDVKFYMMFNEDILNEERLNEMILLLKTKRKKLADDMERIGKEADDFHSMQRCVTEQSVEKESYDRIKVTIEDLNKQQEKVLSEITAARQAEAAFRDKQAETADSIRKSEKESDSTKRNIQELEALMKDYASYISSMHQLEKIRIQQQALEKHKTQIKDSIKSIENKTRSLELSIRDNMQEAERIRTVLSGLEQYGEVTRPKNFDENMEADINTMEARYHAILEKTSRQLQELEKTLREAQDRLSKSERDLKRYAEKHGISSKEWQDCIYSEAAEDINESDMKLAVSIRGGLDKSYADIDKKCAVSANRLERMLKDIRDDCGKELPLDEAEIVVRDYPAEKVVLHDKMDEIKRSIRMAEKRQNIYSGILDALARFEGTSKEMIWDEDYEIMPQDELRALSGRMLREYDQACTAVSGAKLDTLSEINRLLRDRDYSDGPISKTLESFVRLIDDPERLLLQIDMTIQASKDSLEKLMVDIAIIEQEKEHVTGMLLDYTKDVHEQLGKIDRNSTIPIRGRAVKMLRIDMPEWEDGNELYKMNVSALVDDIRSNALKLNEKEESVHEYVGKRLTSRELYNSVVGIGNIHIQLYKIEEQREYPITWNEVAKNSGGEGFLSAFVILSSLLYYMRRDDTDIFADRNEGKVLLMDNPFAQTNASHLLKPLMEMAKKNNTQLICLTGLGGDSIYSRFDNIYVLKLIAASLGGGRHYLKGSHVSGSDPEIVSTARLQVMDDDGQMSLIF